MSGKMVKKGKATSAARRRHTEEFRREALLLAARTGVASAATELGIQASLLYDWQNKGKRPVTTPCPASRAVATSRAQSKEVRDVTGVEAGGLGEAGSGVRAQRAVAAGLVRRTWLERVFAGRMALPAAA